MAPKAAICASEKYDRAAHTYGKSVIDLARGLARDYANPPDVVAYPKSEADVAAHSIQERMDPDKDQGGFSG